MKKQIGLMTLSLMLVSPALAGGAGAPVKAKPTTCKSIAQIVAGDAQFSTLATAVEAAGLTSAMSGQGSYTVFAPTNAAFAKVPSDQLAGLLNDAEALKGLILYHVVGEKATLAQIRGVKGGTTMQGADITVNVQGNKVMINNATVTRGDLVACNGIVHVIDTVLLPPAPEAQAPAPAPEAAPAAPEAAPAPEPAPVAAPAPAAAPIVIPALPLRGATVTQQTTTTTTDTSATTTTDTSATTTTDTSATTETTTTDTSAADTSTTDTSADMSTNTVYDVIANDDRFSTLRDLISDADLSETLTTGEYTIFAPTDEAFDAIPEDILAAIRSDPAAIKAVLSYHVVAQKLTQDQINAGTDINTVQGGVLDIGTATLGTALEASNGVVYPIDVVLMPPDFKVPDVAAVAADTSTTSPNITTYLLGDDRFSTLRGLLVTAGLADTLTTGTYTIFAPTNDAFAKYDQTKLANLTKDKEKLKAMLNYLLVAARLEPANVITAPLKTLEGTELTVTQDGSNLKVGDAVNDGKDIVTGNGNVYVIDTLILPASLR